jgi:DNA-binding transcriptional ArsR family regulator
MTLRALQQNLARAVLALCQLSARADDGDARVDVTDEALLLLDAASSGADTELIRLRVSGALAVVDRLAGSVHDDASVARARLWLLRVQAVLGPAPATPKRAAAQLEEKVAVPEPVKRPRTAVGKSQKAVLQWVLDNQGRRNRDIVEHFAGTLSLRTVKRSLSELTDAGLISRGEVDGYTVYSKPEVKSE